MPEPPPVITTILPFAVALFSSLSGCSSSGTLRWIVFVNWNGKVYAKDGSVRSVLMIADELLVEIQRDFVGKWVLCLGAEIMLMTWGKKAP
jgi:hypothetical protein